MRKQILLIFSSFLLVSHLHASILHVPSEYATIQEGIDAANNGDTVLVASGTYTGYGNNEISFLGKAILVTSEMGLDSTTVEGEWAYRGFRFQNNESYSSILRGFTIAHMEHGIWIENASPIIEDCRMFECVVEMLDGGGGIYMSNSNALIMNCIFEYCMGWPQSEGPAIRAVSGNPSIINSLFFGNFGGYLDQGVVLCDASDSSYIQNCTFYDNWPRALFVFNTIVTNCISWNNAYGIIADVVTYSDLEGYWPGEGNISEDPLFVDPENGDYHLQYGSPCINAGDPDYVTEPDETDIDGQPRVLRGRIDMGVDEVPYLHYKVPAELD